MRVMLVAVAMVEVVILGDRGYTLNSYESRERLDGFKRDALAHAREQKGINAGLGTQTEFSRRKGCQG